MKWLKHAFALSDGESAEPTASQREAIDRILQEVVRRRMTVPAVMLLETCRPLNYVGSQLLVFFSPLMKIALGTQAQDDFARFLERRGSIDYLLDRLESFSGKGSEPTDDTTPETTASQTGD
jgi:hypothetical protein